MSDAAVWTKIDEHTRKISEHSEAIAVMKAGLKSVEDRGERMASEVAGLKSEVKQGNERIYTKLEELSTQIHRGNGAHAFAWKITTVLVSLLAICVTIWIALK